MSDISTPQSFDTITVRQCKAWAWNHGFLDENRWQCKYCPKSYDSSTMTHPNTHLMTKHNIRDQNQCGNPTLPTKLSESSKAFFTKKIPFKREVFQSCLIDWILQARISFHEIESKAFRDMIFSLRPEAEETLSCANTIWTHCMQRFQETREQIKDLFIVAK